jgi:hypothetical protein
MVVGETPLLVVTRVFRPDGAWNGLYTPLGCCLSGRTSCGTKGIGGYLWHEARLFVLGTRLGRPQLVRDFLLANRANVDGTAELVIPGFGPRPKFLITGFQLVCNHDWDRKHRISTYGKFMLTYLSKVVVG